MDPVVTQVDNNRAATLQGTLFLHPTGCSDRIATFYGLPQTSIATLSVTSSTKLLYNAIAEYAAMVPPHNQALVKPLFVSPQDSFECSLKKELTDDSDEEYEELERQRKKRRFEPKKGPTIKFKWALGETTVVWPPPPNLDAERLSQEKRDQHRFRSSASAIHVVERDTAKGNDAISSPDKNDLIYLVHYFLQPQGIETPEVRVILMASPKATKLRIFAQEVLQWQLDKNHIESESTQYSLHRFRCDGDSGYWQREGMKRARPPKSVILHEDQMEDIISDVSEFLSSSTRKWYIGHGLPYRRCFLFYGPPGTGKTSTVRAIASHFGMTCYFLNMTSSSFSNQMLADAFSGIPAGNSLLVLEDVDTLFNEDRKSEVSKSLTFSGLLNSLDGLLSADGVLTCMTTNHVGRLDDALIRAGRVDRRFFFGHPSKSQIVKLFLTFYPDVPPEVSKGFADAVVARPPEEKAQNFATLQELFTFCRKKTAEQCIRAVPTFFKTLCPSESA